MHGAECNLLMQSLLPHRMVANTATNVHRFDPFQGFSTQLLQARAATGADANQSP